MRNLAMALTAATCFTLAACGGGGGVASTPMPAPAPAPSPSPTPAPVPQTITNLTSNQSFSTISATTDTRFDLTSATVTDATSAHSTLTITYDAPSKTYTVTTGGRRQPFGTAAAQSGSQLGEAIYKVSNGGTTDYLTLVTKPYSQNASNSYVGLGYWQRLEIVGTTQTNTFDSFVYGFATPDAAVPRTGSAGYVIDAFGLLLWPGKEPKVISGSGTFDIDLARAVFRGSADVGEFSLASYSYGSGGGILLQTEGTISSNNHFSGNFSYAGFDGIIGGKLYGSFFGPTAQELGATFSGNNSAGAALTGSLMGQVNPNAAPKTLVLDNIVSRTSLPEHFAEFTYANDTSLNPSFRGTIGAVEDAVGTVTFDTDGSAVARLDASIDREAIVTEADRSTLQRPNFDSYDVIIANSVLGGAGPAHVDLFKRGSANQQIDLTYASFGIWTQDFNNGTASQTRKEFMIYGLETPKNLLVGRTGSARYSGVVYGSTSDANHALVDVGGTSSFNVDFGAQTYSGSLNLTTGPQALGTWTFNDSLSSEQFNPTGLYNNGAIGPAGVGRYNSIAPHFYGPDGDEIAATFAITSGWPSDLNSTAITGVTVAKRN